jgi:hypothetical protein
MDPDLNKKDEINNFIPDKPIKQKKNKTSIILTVIIFILAISLAIFVKPAITGYVVANNFEETNMNVSDFIEEQELTKSDLSLIQNKKVI